MVHVFELAEAAAGGLTVPAKRGDPSCTCTWQRSVLLERKQRAQNAAVAKCQSNYCQMDKRWKCARLSGATTAHPFSNSASLFVFFRYQTSIMSFCCSCRQTYRQITRKLSCLWGPLWYLWADGMGSSIGGSFNGLSKPLSQKSSWPLRSLRDFLRGKRPISCPPILPWIQTDWSPSSHVSLFMYFWDYDSWLPSWQQQTFYMLVL